MKSNSTLRVAFVLLALLAAAAAAGALVSAPAPAAAELARAFSPPSRQHWIGCDAFGIDLGRELLIGARHSLSIAVMVTLTNLATGLVIGTAAAVAPGPLALVFTRLIDSFLAFPGLLLAILLASIMPHSENTVFIALAATGWAARARFCRTAVREISRQPHVEASVAAGAGFPRVVARHVWPLMLGQLLIQGALAAGGAITAETSLAFLGLAGSGLDPTWGQLIAQGRDYLVEAPHLSVFPGLAFVTAVLAFTLLAEGLRQALDTSKPAQ